MAARRYHFDERYREQVTLGDGTVVTLRTLRHGDRGLLLRVFESLSAESRYLRFFSGKRSLSDAELSALTELDGVYRFAIVAVVELPGGGEDSLGVARFARSEDAPEIAEPAVTVVDRAQGKGLGTALLQRLAAAARERGVERFRCEFLAGNQRIRRLIEEHARDAWFEPDGSLVRAELPVPEPLSADAPFQIDRGNILFRLLSHSARGGIELKLGRLLLKWRD